MANIEKCVQSENYLSQVMVIFVEMINLKAHFWNYYSKGHALLNVLEKNIKNQLSHMKEFDKVEQKILN